MAKVLVTGGAGFVASHVIAELLRSGHTVKASLRKLSRKDEVLAMMSAAGISDVSGLSFFEADLTSDQAWAEAMATCDYVQHVASPFPPDKVHDENILIKPAREGAIRILTFARDAGVKRVVMTSSFAAIGYGHPKRTEAYDESSWTNTDEDIPAYHKSKAIAEKAAWDFIAKEGRGLELVVLNPNGIFGPALGKDLSSSIEMIQKLIKGEISLCPRIYFGAVDVRDVANIHVQAMTEAEAAGERFILADQTLSLFEVGQILKRSLGEKSGKIPKREAPDWIFKIIGHLVPSAREILSELGMKRVSSNAKARKVFHWTPIPAEEAITESGKSLWRLGLLP